MISLSPNWVSHTTHCLADLTRDSVHVLHVTCAHGFITGTEGFSIKVDSPKNGEYARNMIRLFEKPFLHDGHIGSCWSSFFFVVSLSPEVGLKSSEREASEDTWKENLTGIRFFRLLHDLK
jgi:hypothetical protein